MLSLVAEITRRVSALPHHIVTPRRHINNASAIL